MVLREREREPRGIDPVRALRYPITRPVFSSVGSFVFVVHLNNNTIDIDMFPY